MDQMGKSDTTLHFDRCNTWMDNRPSILLHHRYDFYFCIDDSFYSIHSHGGKTMKRKF